MRSQHLTSPKRLFAPRLAPRIAGRPLALACALGLLATKISLADQSATPTAASLKDKSDTELLQLVTGEKDPPSQRSDEPWDDRVKPSPLDRLWEMPARDAALAFVTDHLDKEVTGIRFEIAEPNARPPAKGEIGMRWISGNKYAPREEGVTILRFDGYESVLLTSQVEPVGHLSKQELERAVMKTDSHRIRRLVAQQTYEILWWLRHVRTVGTPSTYTSGTSSSADDFGHFWMKPDGPEIKRAIFSEPCGQCIGEQSGRTSYESFAVTLIGRLKERSGIKERYPIPKVGRSVDNDPDSIFLRTNPPPDGKDKEATRKWVGRLLAILQNPKREFLYQSVMEVLVPGSEPFRYDDDRINGVLLDVLPRSEKASAALVEPREKEQPELDESTLSNPKALEKEEKAREERRNEHWRKVSAFRNRKWELDSNARTAAAKLGLRHVVSAFPDVLRLSPNEAAAIVARHPELRPKLVEYLQPQLSSEKPPTWPNNAIEMIWRADLRELALSLEKWVNTLPAGDQNEVESLARMAQDAKMVLLTWRETDALTKTKLDIMLTGKIGGGSPIPEMLRIEFEALSTEEKSVIRNFVNWMRTIEVPWSRRYIENFFTPHTPRPDILFER